ncbi:TORTIFOLIA1-like protein 3 isoform X1 [Cucurbita maxima]|uniref:TORTIFOLIA1-like protein 3 isoform X1 n=1 Tax=Cucurbita maxima TaxID=3661 RepID=A0A6J1I8C0_CUCMA|nr:TORTIFOLIA1-like protein 3 isoform X1 [Cucurbita maxima]XP_022972345.1 TORTIFOLIA1-like protein 3 isoform X1 [Cucurbita maxima]
MPLSASVTQSLKLRILSCLTKLSDRDTYSLAASELESIARSLDVSSLPIFLSCIYAIDASDKSLVRKQCVRLFAVLSETHGNYLSPYLAKILSNITRRFRDPDSSVRSACVSSVAALASNVTKPPFSTFLKPLTDSLFTEQDSNSQIGAALSLASAIDAAPEPDLLKLGKLLPRFEKLLKCESFKAKAALLTMIGSIIGLDGAFGNGALKILVPCLVTILSSEDWAARKSAAEALGKLAVVERDALAEFKAGCLKTFESRRFDKVKAVREAMSQMLEAWKQIPDLSDEASAPYSQSSSKEIASDGRYLPGSKNISSACLDAPLPRKNSSLVGRSTPPDASSATTTRRRSASNGGDQKTSLSMFQKVERKKPLDWKVEVSVRKSPSGDLKERDEYIPDRRFSENTKISKPETKRALFNKISDDKIIKFGGFRSGSRVVPCPEEGPESTVVASNATDDLHRNHKDSEELHLIRNQLNQIEKKQSNLLDILQNFIGSSQNGMRSLETRVHGLELALDEISYDLAASTGRMSNANTPRITCCMLPGADFFSSRFCKRANGRGSTPKFAIPSGVTPLAPMRSKGDRHGTNGDAGSINLENHSFQVQRRGGFIVNPLAVRQGESRVVSDASTSLNDLTRRH